jgi:hypothetical protein
MDDNLPGGKEPHRLNTLRAKLAMTTALAGVLFGYGNRVVQAGACTGAVGVYNCSGASAPLTDTTQNFLNNSAAVSITTSSGFGIDSSANSTLGAINVSYSTAGISITDNNASTISGAGFGIRAFNNGSSPSGNITITSNGQVNGIGPGQPISGGRTGISAQNQAAGGTISITANGASGDNRGIFANASGGATDITTNGAISGGSTGITSLGAVGISNTIIANGSVTGTSGYGILASTGGGGSLSITVASGGSVSGGASGIYSSAYNSTAAITISGTVSGGSRAGIDVNQAAAGGVTNISLNSGANVSATSGIAISDGIYNSGSGTYNYDTTANVTVNAGATVTGAINLGDGTDSVTFNGGSIAGVTVIDGGNGTDAVTFTNGSANVMSSQITNVENFTIGSGGTVNFDGALTSNVTVQNGGILSAGSSPGLMTIAGDLGLDSGSTTLVEIGGLTAGTDYDQIDVSDTATLTAGAIFDIDFFSGFTAGLGDFFDVLVADVFVGALDDLTFDFSGAGLGSGLDWEVSFVAAGGTLEALRLTVVAGDTGAVPEPGSMVLLGIGMLGLLGIRRGRRRRHLMPVTRAYYQGREQAR